MNRNSSKRLALLCALCAAALSAGLASSAHAATFSNPLRITMPAGAPVVRDGNADPYPSAISVSGVNGTVTKVTATLHGFEHTYPQDVDILLVGPQGQATYLMSDAGDTSGAVRDRVELTFDDSAPPLPCQDYQVTLPGGTYAPTNDPITAPLDCFQPADVFPAPAPAGPYGAALSVFNGIDPNGTWNLYVVDDEGNDYGSIGGGWSLDFTIAPPTVGQPSIGGPAEVGKTLTATSGPIDGAGAASHQWSRCNLAGAACAPIAGAGANTYANTYVPVAADKGHTLIVTDTATNSGGSASASSAPTAAVGPPVVLSTGTKRVQRVLRQRGLIALASSNIGGGLAARATVSIGGASKVYRFKSVSRTLAPGVGTKARLKLSKRALSAVRSALNRGKKLTAKLSLTVTDANGAQTTRKLSIRLR
jgi:subtilisin-like proprotein convertase family protein